MVGPAWRALCAVVLSVAAVFVHSGGASAQDYRPAFRPETLKRTSTATPNEVLVLGTAHLSGIKALTPSMLDPLLDRLVAWAPTAIATEEMSGLQCDSLRRLPARYAETVETYCADPTAAGRATGLDVAAANTEAERLLAHWPAQPAAVERRHLAAVFLAAGEQGSALVQWLRLAPAERRADDGLTQELAATLDRIAARRNETTLVAAVLAARLGLERLWSVDDHSADTPDSADPAEAKARENAITRAWDNEATRNRLAANTTLENSLSEPDGILALYRTLNAADQPALVYRSDFGAALDEPSPQGFGRGYVGYWETRNLRMVANIRDVLARQPGVRMLAIVGASHKGYYEAYLNQMHDVQLVDSAVVLQ